MLQLLAFRRDDAEDLAVRTGLARLGLRPMAGRPAARGCGRAKCIYSRAGIMPAAAAARTPASAAAAACHAGVARGAIYRAGNICVYIIYNYIYICLCIAQLGKCII